MASTCTKNTLLVVRFSCFCPEPVLAKDRFSSGSGTKSRRRAAYRRVLLLVLRELQRRVPARTLMWVRAEAHQLARGRHVALRGSVVQRTVVLPLGFLRRVGLSASHQQRFAEQVVVGLGSKMQRPQSTLALN
eukprot:COSAG06_NODE_8972_length_2021_cov_1.828824_3_plen_133_part_00